VLSGTAISDKHAPAFCTIEYAANSVDYKEVGLIAPWAFMLAPGAQKSMHFTIPISLPDEYKDVLVGMIRLIVYMDDVNVIPYDNESSQYDMKSADKRRLLIKAIMKEVNPSASRGADFVDMPKSPLDLEGGELDTFAALDGEFGVEANVVSKEDRVVIDIKIATDYDDMLQFQNEGYEVFCTQVTWAAQFRWNSSSPIIFTDRSPQRDRSMTRSRCGGSISWRSWVRAPRSA